MGLLIWFTMGLAVWHFSVFVPDRFWGGIVGALVGSIAGSMVVGLAVQEGRGRAMDVADLSTVLVAIPGAAIGLAVIWIVGARQGET